MGKTTSYSLSNDKLNSGHDYPVILPLFLSMTEYLNF